MSEKQKSRAKKVVYRKIHKSLRHLTANDTKHAFDERLRGAHQRQESEPAFFGVSVMSTPESDIFQKITSNNYQEAAKQRATSKHQAQRHGTRPRPDRESRSSDQFHQVDGSRRTHPREPTIQDPPKAVQREGIPGAQSTHSQVLPIPFHPSDPIPHAKQSFPSFLTPSSITSPDTSLPFTFGDLTVHPSMAFVEDSGLGTGPIIHRSFHQEPDFQETCRGQFPSHSNLHALTLPGPLYDLPTGAYNFSQQTFEFPFAANNHSFHITDPDLHTDWFSG